LAIYYPLFIFLLGQGTKQRYSFSCLLTFQSFFIFIFPFLLRKISSVLNIIGFLPVQDVALIPRLSSHVIYPKTISDSQPFDDCSGQNLLTTFVSSIQPQPQPQPIAFPQHNTTQPQQQQQQQQQQQPQQQQSQQGNQASVLYSALTYTLAKDYSCAVVSIGPSSQYFSF
jgi:hypothetical protein